MKQIDKANKQESRFNISDAVLDELLKDYKTPEDLLGSDGILKELTKRALERIMNAEMDHHLNDEYNPESGRANGNTKNGKGHKTVKGSFGEIEIETPRDRQSTFEPVIVPKRQHRTGPIDKAIMALYVKGMTTRDIQDTVKELYGIDVSPTLVADVASAMEDDAREWQNRRLDPVYPIVWLDAIVVKVHSGSKVTAKAVQIALGLNMDGRKELLGAWITENEGAAFWGQVLTEIRNRGVEKILIACMDGLKGFPEAVRSVYPETEIQLCMVHMMRASLKYVPHKDKKAVACGLKKIYDAATEDAAKAELENFKNELEGKYPLIARQWETKWDDLRTIFQYPSEIRNVIYTTNAIESLNMSLRKITRNRRIFPNDESALKIITLGILEASKKWTQPIRNWSAALSYFVLRHPEIEVHMK